MLKLVHKFYLSMIRNYAVRQYFARLFAKTRKNFRRSADFMTNKAKRENHIVLTPAQYVQLASIGVGKAQADKFIATVNKTGNTHAYVNSNRVSGDADTGIGNVVLAISMFCGAIYNDGKKLFNFDLFDDGDDCLLFMRKQDKKKIPLMVNNLKEMGMDVEIGSVETPRGVIQFAETMEEIEFCQGRVVKIYREYKGVYKHWWVLVRNPRKVLSHLPYSQQYGHIHPKVLGRYMRTKLGGENWINEGVPVISSITATLFHTTNKFKSLPLKQNDPLAYRFYINLGVLQTDSVKKSIITPTTRASYEAAFGHLGYDQATQLAIEKNYNCNNILNIDYSHNRIKSSIQHVWLYHRYDDNIKNLGILRTFDPGIT